MKTKLNLASAILLQVVTVFSGLILPRIIISNFGSEINGLLSSITQFLNFIALLEGGIGAVILAELYKPIEERNTDKIEKLLGASSVFFRKLAIVFVFYTLLLAVVYPFIVDSSFGFGYVSTLILIISVVTLMQYLFSVTNRLLLQANQEVYIVNLMSAVTVALNLVFTIIIVTIVPNIHIVKIGSSVAFLIQPIFYDCYVKKKYGYKRLYEKDFKIPNRWSGFSQNLAHFINMNTDIILISIFGVLSDASVYTVYLLAMNAIKQVITAINNSYQSNLGKYIAQENREELEYHFYKFTGISWVGCTVLFTTCLLLINQFVAIYTAGITDANYYRPGFALVMTLAQFIYCVREPYRFLILAGGKFKETNFGAVMEALLNIIISLVLIKPFGLLGVAIGTFVAITYRLFYFLYFLKDNIIGTNAYRIIPVSVAALCVWVVNIVLYNRVDLNIDSFPMFLVYGLVVVTIESLLASSLFYAFQKIGFVLEKKR